MRNLDNYTPAARTSHVHGMSDVFRAPDGVHDRGELWVKTSVSLRADTRMRLKRFAAAHDMKLQDVIDEALDAYLGKGL